MGKDDIFLTKPAPFEWGGGNFIPQNIVYTLGIQDDALEWLLDQVVRCLQQHTEGHKRLMTLRVNQFLAATYFGGFSLSCAGFPAFSLLHLATFTEAKSEDQKAKNRQIRRYLLGGPLGKLVTDNRDQNSLLVDGEVTDIQTYSKIGEFARRIDPAKLREAIAMFVAGHLDRGGKGRRVEGEDRPTLWDDDESLRKIAGITFLLLARESSRDNTMIALSPMFIDVATRGIDPDVDWGNIENSFPLAMEGAQKAVLGLDNKKAKSTQIRNRKLALLRSWLLHQKTFADTIRGKDDWSEDLAIYIYRWLLHFYFLEDENGCPPQDYFALAKLEPMNKTNWRKMLREQLAGRDDVILGAVTRAIEMLSRRGDVNKARGVLSNCLERAIAYPVTIRQPLEFLGYAQALADPMAWAESGDYIEIQVGYGPLGAEVRQFDEQMNWFVQFTSASTYKALQGWFKRNRKATIAALLCRARGYIEEKERDSWNWTESSNLTAMALLMFGREAARNPRMMVLSPLFLDIMRENWFREHDPFKDYSYAQEVTRFFPMAFSGSQASSLGTTGGTVREQDRDELLGKIESQEAAPMEESRDEEDALLSDMLVEVARDLPHGTSMEVSVDLDAYQEYETGEYTHYVVDSSEGEIAEEAEETQLTESDISAERRAREIFVLRVWLEHFLAGKDEKKTRQSLFTSLEISGGSEKRVYGTHMDRDVSALKELPWDLCEYILRFYGKGMSPAKERDDSSMFGHMFGSWERDLRKIDECQKRLAVEAEKLCKSLSQTEGGGNLLTQLFQKYWTTNLNGSLSLDLLFATKGTTLDSYVKHFYEDELASCFQIFDAYLQNQTAGAGTAGIPGGVKNCGSTCYIASALQVLAALDPYRALFGGATQIGKMMELLLQCINNGTTVPWHVSCLFRGLVNTLIWNRNPLAEREEDVEEFLTGLFGCLGIPGGIAVDYLLNGVQGNQESYHILSCGLPAHILDREDGLEFVTLRDILVSFLHSVDVETNSVHDRRLANAPQVLPIQFKRFQTDKKNRIPIEIPPRISLAGYHYDLAAFIVHLGGSVHAGHYVCYVCRGGQWYKCNDATVTAVQELSELPDAYLCFYSRGGKSGG